ncbi:hypothetical protein [Sulfurimonas denitrificans]|jgi:hypothetical protein|uniref:hypothetical protein n=1 Tax=Sulfurimonas denitrificans TaxID=39766 RepID=UPI0005A09ECA|nr:hypothetical protein [Sulfurimonas denitrificans]MDD3443516.1 hypothetical protein [Sulfurimonas denitrificans]
MNEMYDMSIVTHNWGVIAVLGVILINILMLFGIKSSVKYMRAISLFTPIVGTAIGMVIFTGIVMMASKHLDFTIENIVMILFATALIYLEVKRSKGVSRVNKRDEASFLEYKREATNIFLAEIAVVLSISLWMWV